MIKDDYTNGDGLSWGNAHSECMAYNSKLTSVHSVEEMDALQQVMQGVATKDVWIGLQADGNVSIWFLRFILYIYKPTTTPFISSITIFFRILVNGKWNWVDKSPYDYNNWYDGEPNHNDDNLYCAKIWEEHEERAGKWDDAHCSDLNGYICKIEKCK